MRNTFVLVFEFFDHDARRPASLNDLTPRVVRHRIRTSAFQTAPVETTLLACIREWCPSGAIVYRRRDRSLVELRRFHVPGFPLNDEATAECFGLEIARLFVDTCYRELLVERDAAEKWYLQQSRRRR
jgi:hypothetical protein